MRLSVPSWLVPGGWLANVGVAEGLGWASGVELLLFSFEGEDRELFLSELPGLADAGKRLSLSVHLPDPLLPGHEELVQLTRGFAESFVVHPPKPGPAGGGLEAWAGLLGGWRGKYGDDFLLEYTDGSAFSGAEAACPGLPLCADTGRLLVENIEPAGWFAQRAGRIREVHLHGVSEGRDHRPFSGGEPWFIALRPFLAVFPGRIELEVFSLAGVTTARAALEYPR